MRIEFSYDRPGRSAIAQAISDVTPVIAGFWFVSLDLIQLFFNCHHHYHRQYIGRYIGRYIVVVSKSFNNLSRNIRLSVHGSK